VILIVERTRELPLFLSGHRWKLGYNGCRDLLLDGCFLLALSQNVNMMQNYDILIVGGYGHIGLPLGIMLAKVGYQVALHDIDHEKGKIIAQGEMPFLEYDAPPLLKEVIHKQLHLEPAIEAIQRSKIIIVTIGTPIDEYLNPRLMPIFGLAEKMLPYLTADHLLILRSTVFPGTTQRLHDFFQRRQMPVAVTFCPERIVQGQAIRELSGLPQIVSGFTPEAIARAREVFCRLGQEVVVGEVMEAELAKLFSNAWRYIQFATANQFYMIAEQNNVDFQRIHHLVTHNYERAKDFPKAGLTAGPCLLKDTMQLAAFYQNNFLLGQAAMTANEGLPAFLVEQLRQQFALSQHTVGLLGMAFKGNIDDTRDSLAYKLRKLLLFHGATVLCSDEFVNDPAFVSKEELLEKSSIVILSAPHRAYRELSLPKHLHLVDVWGFFPSNHA
jgi:UDP-N-acetyl-D-mannosaminuronic acid dehydrogenase